MDTAQEWRPRLTRIEGGEGVAFSHPCHVCGNPIAPFGEDTSLRKSKPGRWTCFAHWPGRDAAIAAREAQAARQAALVAANEQDAF